MDYSTFIKQKLNLSIPLFDIMVCFSDALDLISPAVSGHQIRTAYIALKIAQEYKLPKKRINNLVIAACIHDIGVTTAKEKNAIMDENFESDSRHEEIGYYYIKDSGLFNNECEIVRYHHKNWNNGQAPNIPIESYILCLADRIDSYIDKNEYILNQVTDINNKVIQKSGDVFNPDIVKAFLRLSKKEYFWLNILSNRVTSILNKESKLPKMSLDINKLHKFTKWFSNVIDFRSRFTSVHSRGVAASASAIGIFLNLSKEKIQVIEISGFLHDLGKLAVPNLLLEKNDKLTSAEFGIMRAHTYYTYQVLSSIKDIKHINEYASYHHERIDGKGYPFHIKGKAMTFGSRILAVADIYTAIAEHRPYRVAMDKESVIKVISNKADDKCLDSNICKVLIDKYDIIDEIRKTAQLEAQNEYENFWRQIV